MTPSESDFRPSKLPSERRDLFATTSWTAVLEAQGESTAAAAALEALCVKYWFPVYVYVRRRGCSAEDAEDFTQGFFQFFLHNRRLHLADRARGRFRAYLLAVLKGYLLNQWEAQRAVKRGGRVQILSLDQEAAEGQLMQLADAGSSPDQDFEKCWAREVLNQALSEVKSEYAACGKERLFDGLKPFLEELPEGDAYESAATALGMTRSAVAVAVHRLRQLYRNHLRRIVAGTVFGADEVEEEMRHLFAALSSTRA